MLNQDEEDMMKMMGFANFDSTKVLVTLFEDVRESMYILEKITYIITDSNHRLPKL